MTALAPPLVLRPAAPDDLPAILEVFNRDARQNSGHDAFALDDLRGYVTMPGFDLERDVRVVTDGARVVGVEGLWHLEPFVLAEAHGAVDPDHRGRGIGTALLTWAEEAARHRASQAPPGTRVAFHTSVDHRDRAGIRLVEDVGMELIRHFFEMVVDLGDPFPRAVIPEGIAIRPYRPGEEEAAVYGALRESFADHWGWIDRPFEEGLERFLHRVRADGFDPSTWWVAEAGEEIVGINLCSPAHERDERFAWCDNLGVRRPWRRRGLARAMLLHAFGEFRRRGHVRMGLGVDAASLTGATALYESVGMEVRDRYALYQKVLREGRSLVRERLD